MDVGPVFSNGTYRERHILCMDAGVTRWSNKEYSCADLYHEALVEEGRGGKGPMSLRRGVHRHGRREGERFSEGMEGWRSVHLLQILIEAKLL